MLSKKSKSSFRNALIFLLTAVLFFLISSCKKTGEYQDNEPFKYSSFRDVPGITEEEIRAVETLQRECDSFIYGMPLSTEAFESDYGDVMGFTALLCQWFSDLFGIPFQPRLFDFAEILSGLETGEISFTGELTATDERMKTYIMTKGIASRPLKTFRLAKSRSPEEIIRERAVRCGFIAGTSTIYTVTAEMADGSYETVLLNDINQVYGALTSGQIDAFYYTGPAEANFARHTQITSQYFYPLTYRPVSLSTRNPALAPIIFVVEKILEDGGMRYMTRLYNEGEQEYFKYRLRSQLSIEEQNYLITNKNREILVGMDPGNYPDSFYDVHDNQWKGIFRDILDEVSYLTGLKFQRANDEKTAWPKIYEMLEKKEIAMVPELIQSSERLGLFLWPNFSQITDHYALISKYDFPNIKVNEILYVKVGLARDTAYTELFNKWFPGHTNTVMYENMEEAFDALQRGKVEMVMANQKRLLYLTHYMELPDYKANVVFDTTINATFGLNNDQVLLCSILEKALGMIDIKSISDQWVRKTYDYRSKLARAQFPWLIGSSVLILCVLFLVIALFIRSRRAGEQLKNIVNKRTRELSLQTVKLQTILDSIPDIIYCKDMNLHYTQCNKVTERFTGTSEKDIIGKTDIDALKFTADVALQIMEADNAVLKEGRKIITEETLPDTDGSTLFLETVRAPLIQNGEIIGLIAIARDITIRKETEEAALAASRSKSAFLANMSHEIRTPMNSIIGFSELALDGEIPSKTKDYLNKIRTNAEWLLQIINDILDISKIESGKLELENIPFDMHELFTSCKVLIMPKAIEKGIMMHFYAEPNMGRRPLGDPTRLRQVLLNLLSNAVKFTNTGMVKVHAAIKEMRDKSVTINFEIKDSGIGMTKEQIDKVFDPFTQAESGTTRKYGGTGLGLSITRNIIEMMGGRLSVESVPKVGSKFSFSLTFDTVDETDKNFSSVKIVLNELEKPAFEGEILLCEDNAMNQQVICEHLSRVGLKTVVANNGKIGLDLVQDRQESGEKQFDLIFMDMHMPVMDGLEAASKIMELDTGIPIVAMTANIMSNDIEVYRRSGINDCVGKPFTSQELWHCLIRYFTPVKWQSVDEIQQQHAEYELRQKLIINFVKDNRNRYREIIQAIESGDTKLAHRLAHTLKSNAGQLGKIMLQKAAAEIENQLKDGKQVTITQLEEFETELNVVLSELSKIASEFSQSAPMENNNDGDLLDRETALDLLGKLDKLIDMGNPDSRKFINELRLFPADKNIKEQLIQQIDDFEFEQARITAQKLRKELN